MRLFSWTLMQSDWCLYKRRKSGHTERQWGTDTAKNDWVETQWGGGRLQATERDLSRKCLLPPRSYLKPIKCIPVIYAPHQSVVFCYSSLSKLIEQCFKFVLHLQFYDFHIVFPFIVYGIIAKSIDSEIRFSGFKSITCVALGKLPNPLFSFFIYRMEMVIKLSTL